MAWRAWESSGPGKGIRSQHQERRHLLGFKAYFLYLHFTVQEAKEVRRVRRKGRQV